MYFQLHCLVAIYNTYIKKKYIWNINSNVYIFILPLSYFNCDDFLLKKKSIELLFWHNNNYQFMQKILHLFIISQTAIIKIIIIIKIITTQSHRIMWMQYIALYLYLYYVYMIVYEMNDNKLIIIILMRCGYIWWKGTWMELEYMLYCLVYLNGNWLYIIHYTTHTVITV